MPKFIQTHQGMVFAKSAIIYVSLLKQGDDSFYFDVCFDSRMVNNAVIAAVACSSDSYEAEAQRLAFISQLCK